MPFTIGGDRIPPEKSKNPPKKIKVQAQKRKGKFVTLVLNVNLAEESLKDLTRFLKQKCHCGGTVKEGVIELQGSKELEVQKALKEYSKEDLNI